MRWLWFLLSLALFAVAFRTHSMGLAALCLLLGLGFLLMGTLALASSRIESAGRDAGTLLAPDELRRMREEIERRKSAGADGTPLAGATTRRDDDDDESVPG